MFAVSLALAAVLVASKGDGDADPPGAALAGATPLIPTATNPPPATGTPLPAATAAVPPELQARLDALPEKLRDQTLAAFADGRLSLVQLEQIATDYENRNPAVRVGSVVAIEGPALRLEVFTTGEQVEIVTGEQTLVRRGEAFIGLLDLMPEELVMVVSTEDGATALTIDAFGVVAP